MNELGRTNAGNYIVEMSKSEYVSFSALEQALAGEEENWYQTIDRERKLTGNDLSRALYIIREWTQGLFYINSLQHYLDQLKDTYQAAKDD